MGKARYILTFALWLGLGGVAFGGHLVTFPKSPITITLPKVGNQYPALTGTDPKINFDIQNIAKSPIAQMNFKVAPGPGANMAVIIWEKVGVCCTIRV